MNNREIRTLAETVAETVIDILIPRQNDKGREDLDVALNAWTQRHAPYDGEPVKSDLSEQETEEILEALDGLYPDPDNAGEDSLAVVIPVDRDWAASFVHNIRRQERRLAAERLRARLGRQFTPSYVETLVEAVNPPETPADISEHHHDEWCLPDCAIPTPPVAGE